MALFTGHTITPDSALGGTQIQKSVKFNSGDSEYLIRTCSSEGNRVKWTWSAWVKKTRPGRSSYALLSSDNGGDGGGNNGIASIYWGSDDKIHTYYDTTSGDNYGAINDAKYRDTNSWYHIVWQVDAANSTSKIWVNGVEQSIASGSQPISGYNYTMNQSGKHMTIGVDAWDIYTYSDTYIAETHYSDGQLYAASDFGYTDAQTGQWRPKNGNVIKSNITYGTNGFWLDFRDNTSTTTLGYDYSGNGNHWTLTNMSVAAGANNNSSEDSPTNNFCTLNPLRRFTHNCTLSDGNLKATGSSESYPGVAADIELTSGKWYYEFQITSKTSNPICGVCQNNYVSGGAGRIMYRADGFYIKSDGSEPSDPASFDVGDIIGVAIDLDHSDGLIRFYKNGSLQPVVSGLNSLKSNLSMSTLGGLLPYIQMYTSDVCVVNFGQRSFNHTPPTGHRALNSKNLATVNAAGVVRPQRFFDTVLYTGNSSTNKITGFEFKPDLVWVKRRDSSAHSNLVDSVRGTQKHLQSSGTGSEDTETGSNGLISFNEDGFTVSGTNSGTGRINYSGNTFVAWCWKAGGTAVSNTDGDITSSVSVNEEAGFSIATYTGSTASGALTVGHGLGKKPAWVIIKRRDDTGDWIIGHQGLATNAFANNKFVKFDNAAVYTNALVWGAEPTTTVTQIVSNGAGGATNLTSSGTYVMYSWAEIPGYSAFGSYTGNGNSDGTYVHLGFRPAWVLIDNYGASGFNWVLQDNKRSPFNLCDNKLNPDSDAAEQTNADKLDMLANGFKCRVADAGINASGSSYIYMAFAERPSRTIFGLDANAR